MTEELQPCPFCGDRMKHVHDTVSHARQGDCVIGAQAWGGNNAVERWNRRARPSPTGEKVEAVEHYLTSAVGCVLDAIQYAAANCIKADGQKTVHDLTFVAKGYVSEISSAIAALVAERDDLATKWRQAIAIGMLHAERATTAERERDEARALIRWAHDTLYEINPSNYDHDEVCKLNDASVEVILGLAPTLGETHGKSKEWWAAQRASAESALAANARVERLERALYEIAAMPPAGAFMCGSIAHTALTGDADGKA